MNFQFYVEKLQSSEIFKNFVNSGKENKQHFDYYLPEEKKIESVQLENMQIVPIESFGELPKKVSFDLDFDFGEIEKMIEQKMLENGIKNKIQKILLSLQNSGGKDVLVGTVFISMLGMIGVTIGLKKMEIIGFEKKSLLDIIKISKKK